MVAVPESPRVPRDTSAFLLPCIFKHPLLQLSVRSKDSAARYADFGRLVRRALDLRLTPARRAERAEQVLAAIQVLNLSRGDTDALRGEWLEQVAEDCGTPTLLEALAQSRLAEHDLRLTPFGRPGLNAADLEMPRLLPLRERAGSGSSALVPKTVSDVWRKAVSLALEAVTLEHVRAVQLQPQLLASDAPLARNAAADALAHDDTAVGIYSVAPTPSRSPSISPARGHQP